MPQWSPAATTGEHAGFSQRGWHVRLRPFHSSLGLRLGVLESLKSSSFPGFTPSFLSFFEDLARKSSLNHLVLSLGLLRLKWGSPFNLPLFILVRYKDFMRASSLIQAQGRGSEATPDGSGQHSFPRSHYRSFFSHWGLALPASWLVQMLEPAVTAMVLPGFQNLFRSQAFGRMWQQPAAPGVW